MVFLIAWQTVYDPLVLQFIIKRTFQEIFFHLPSLLFFFLSTLCLGGIRASFMRDLGSFPCLVYQVQGQDMS